MEKRAIINLVVECLEWIASCKQLSCPLRFQVCIATVFKEITKQTMLFSLLPVQHPVFPAGSWFIIDLYLNINLFSIFVF